LRITKRFQCLEHVDLFFEARYVNFELESIKLAPEFDHDAFSCLAADARDAGEMGGIFGGNRLPERFKRRDVEDRES